MAAYTEDGTHPARVPSHARPPPQPRRMLSPTRAKLPRPGLDAKTGAPPGVERPSGCSP